MGNPSQTQTNLQQTVAQQRQRQTERARNPYSIEIELDDHPPELCIEVRDGDMVISRLLPPVTGKLILHFKDGQYMRPGLEI